MVVIRSARGALRGSAALLVAIACSAFTTATVLPRQQNDANRPWVTIDANGAVQTITPTVNGGSSFTGSESLPTADANGAGAFLVCSGASNFGGLRAPFCAPESNQDVTVGKTIFITWETALFESPDTVLQVQGDFSTSDGMGGTEGFTSVDMVSSKGFYAWTIDESYLQNGKATAVQFFFAYPNQTEIRDRDPGPTIRIVPAGGSGGGPNAAVIAVPVVLGLLALAGIAFFVRWYGRRKGMFGGKSGYGVRKSRIQRVGGPKGTNIRLADGTFSSNRGVEPPMPDGGNAFRNELRRQDQQR